MANINKNAKKVLEKRYLLKDEKGEVIETPDQLFKRVAKAITQNEDSSEQENVILEKKDQDTVSFGKKNPYEDEFYNMLSNLEFLPNSPTLMNAGKPDGQLSACFVLPVGDRMSDIFDTIKNAALIHKSGGGTGFSFSRLRPKGSTVNSTNGVASGPVSFMKVFDSATEAVKQGGARRGANMGILRVDHPDILEFIQCKSDNSTINNFNISIGVTTEFMQALNNKEKYSLINPKTNETMGSLEAQKVWDLMIEMSWKNGEPGILFIDRVNEYNPTPSLGDIEATNPCGEQVLLPYESCNLGSINLTKIVKDKKVDYSKLREITKLAVRFLDNVIDVNKYPLPEIEDITKKVRKIGLGVMGFADMLFILGIPYGSKESIDIANTIMYSINKISKEASAEIAEEKGVFPEYYNSIFYITSSKDNSRKVNEKAKTPLRNATTTTIAPTGTISLIAGVSSGIEPLFALSYIRNIMDGEEMVEVNPIFEKALKDRNLYSKELLRRVAEKGSVQDIEEIPEDLKRIFITAHDITPKQHVIMQSVFQQNTDNAVSKTVNLPHNATKEDINKIIHLAYETDCKGITVYRDGSRDMQVLNIGEVKGKNDKEAVKEEIKEVQKASTEKENVKIIPKQRPETLSGSTERFTTACGNLYITVNGDDKDLCEVFTNTGKSGGCPSQSEAISRLISIALRSGVYPNYITEQLKGIKCPAVTRVNKERRAIKGLSCPDIIGRMIEKVIEKNKKLEEEKERSEELIGMIEKEREQIKEEVEMEERRLEKELERKFKGMACPDCSEPVESDGGCQICKNCGWSKCF